MKFWLTVILSIIGLSGGLTWLLMKGGRPADMTPYAKASPKSDAPQNRGKLVFILNDKQVKKGNVIESEHGDSFVDKEYSMEFRFRNDGKEPLALGLTRLSCVCLRDFYVDGKPIKVQEQLPPKPPGQEGVMKMTWKPTDMQLPRRAPPKLERFTATFFTSDPAYSSFELEIVTRLVNNKE